MSGMTRRVRKPTARALDAAQSRLLEQANRNLPHNSAPSPNSAAVKRKGRAVNAKGQTAVAQDQARASAQATEEEESEEFDQQDREEEDQDQPDLTLYCVCLGYDTGEQPMIQCEHCTNWFHFDCIGITEEIAAQIEGYACEMCQQMGVGTTRMLSTASVAPPIASTSKTDDPISRSHPEDQDADEDVSFSDDEESGIDDENDEDPMGHDEDDDYGADGSARKRRRGKQVQARAGRAARRRKLEPDLEGGSDGSYDEDEDEGEEGKGKGKKKTSTNRRTPNTPARPRAHSPLRLIEGAEVSQATGTRAAVVKQFTATFSSIYSASSNSDIEDVPQRAKSFAEAVEQELLNGYYEIDDKGFRAPRAKYTSKFRSLQFNLKTNAVFRSRIAHDEFDAAGIVNISAEDLQTPELKAMAESVRAASLKNSVKEALVAPTAKRTHKGEEEMENNSARLEAEEEAAMKEIERKKAVEEKRGERSGSVSQAESPFPDESRSGGGGAFAGSPSPATPDPQGDTSSDPFSRPRHRPSLTGSSSHNFEGDVPESTRSPSVKQGSLSSRTASPFASTAKRDGSPAVVKNEEGEGVMSPPPQPRQRNSSSTIDMSAIWGKAKAASPSVEPKGEGEGEGGDDTKMEDETGESDLFSFQPSKDEDDDDFEKNLFRSNSQSPVKKQPKPPAPAPPRLPAISELPPVWAGDLIVTEEGGFPSFGVQIGGRPVGTDSKTWSKLLPQGLTTAGRISTHQASKYLVDCTFAPTRELIILALLPDTTGPSDLFPHKPTGDRCLAKHSHIFNYYLQKDRIGVIQGPKELSQLVKDIYIIPLPKEHPLPEYVELLDEHLIPEAGERDQNLLLCVLVLQKGVLPTVRSKPLEPSPVSTPPPPPASSQPAAVPATSSVDPSSIQSLLSGVDPTTLQSLLSNPEALSALTTSQSQAILNTANSQRSLPLSVPTGPRSSSSSGGGGGGGGPPIHPSRLAQLPLGGSANAFSGYVPRPPTGPARTESSGGGPHTGLGGFNSQGQHFEHNLTGQGEYGQGMGDGGWGNSAHRGGGGGYRGGRGAGYGTPRGGGYGRGRGRGGY
ncbi:uncharacterized protein JCM6883_003616 [Sporobolomyces salmoneus]|uniref:uncharacterized protein n=1 Tax=Sporobolomyces salmoneus TaxID=183962 RepID=UPI003171D8F4